MTIEIGALIAGIGCLVGLAGWMYNRDKRTSEDAEWRGQINAKLDELLKMKSDLSRMDIKIEGMLERIAKVEASASSAHKRLDEHLREGK